MTIVEATAAVQREYPGNYILVFTSRAEDGRWHAVVSAGMVFARADANTESDALAAVVAKVTA